MSYKRSFFQEVYPIILFVVGIWLLLCAIIEFRRLALESVYYQGERPGIDVVPLDTQIEGEIILI